MKPFGVLLDQFRALRWSLEGLEGWGGDSLEGLFGAVGGCLVAVWGGARALLSSFQAPPIIFCTTIV